MPSDRLPLIEMAINLVGTLKTLDLTDEAPEPLTEAESDAYDAALSFLSKQFRSGPSKLSSHLVSTTESRQGITIVDDPEISDNRHDT